MKEGKRPRGCTGTTSFNLWLGARRRRTRDVVTEGILDDRGLRAKHMLLISKRGARRPWPKFSNGDTCAPQGQTPGSNARVKQARARARVKTARACQGQTSPHQPLVPGDSHAADSI